MRCIFSTYLHTAFITLFYDWYSNVFVFCRGGAGYGDHRPRHVPVSSAWNVRAGRRRLSRDVCFSDQACTGALSAQLVHLRLHRRQGQGLPAHRTRSDTHTAETEPGRLHPTQRTQCTQSNGRRWRIVDLTTASACTVFKKQAIGYFYF